jgi:3-methyladenine DNA glycosylase AlkD
MDVGEIQKKLAELGNPAIAISSQRFFKTGPGDYGEGDLFRGVRVPVLRKLSREYSSIALREVEKLLKSKFHEDRLLALFLLVRQFAKSDEAAKKKICSLYLKNTRFINNWDMVDSSAEQIVGAYLWDKDRKPLYDLAKSKNLWERRIAIMATFQFIKQGEFDETLKIAKKLLTDNEDLIHKAVGWMLREIGNRDLDTEERFLRENYGSMPRTMLRYAIEKFPEDKRQMYLKSQVH